MGLLDKLKKQDNKYAQQEVSQAANLLVIQQEFENWLKILHEISKTIFTKEVKRVKLREQLDNLSENAYIQYFPQILQIIQRKKEDCMEYRNTEEQVKNILDWLPRLKDHDALVELIIKKRRSKYKLPV